MPGQIVSRDVLIQHILLFHYCVMCKKFNKLRFCKYSMARLSKVLKLKAESLKLTLPYICLQESVVVAVMNTRRALLLEYQ